MTSRLLHLSTIIALMIAAMAVPGVTRDASAQQPDVWSGESSAEIFARIDEQRHGLQQTKDEIAEIDRQTALLQLDLERRRTELADATTLLAEAEDRYQRSIAEFDARLSAMYKMGANVYYEVVLTSESFSDSLARMSYLGIISELDFELLQEVKADQERVRALRERVDGLKQQSSQDIASLGRRRADLESRIAADENSIDSETAALTRARNREAAEEIERQRQEPVYAGDDFSLYSGVQGPAVSFASETSEGGEPSGSIIEGIASWYGPGFHGNTTANGEIYDMYGFTAAHKTLPFNTRLKVTYNGRSVFVRINDRGPYVGNRVIDLSAAAAQQIGLSGIGFVTAEIYR